MAIEFSFKPNIIEEEMKCDLLAIMRPKKIPTNHLWKLEGRINKENYLPSKQSFKDKTLKYRRQYNIEDKESSTSAPPFTGIITIVTTLLLDVKVVKE